MTLPTAAETGYLRFREVPILLPGAFAISGDANLLPGIAAFFLRAFLPTFIERPILLPG